MSDPVRTPHITDDEAAVYWGLNRLISQTPLRTKDLPPFTLNMTDLENMLAGVWLSPRLVETRIYISLPMRDRMRNWIRNSGKAKYNAMMQQKRIRRQKGQHRGGR